MFKDLWSEIVWEVPRMLFPLTVCVGAWPHSSQHWSLLSAWSILVRCVLVVPWLVACQPQKHLSALPHCGNKYSICPPSSWCPSRAALGALALSCVLVLGYIKQEQSLWIIPYLMSQHTGMFILVAPRCWRALELRAVLPPSQDYLCILWLDAGYLCPAELWMA